MQAILCEAIRRRSIIEFEYGGLPRRVEPHCHGYSRGGNELLSAYQSGGRSHSASMGWKVFEVDRITSLIVTPHHFLKPRSTYNRERPGVDQIHCSV